MINCPNCNIGFNPKCRVCPHCQSYTPDVESRFEYLAQAAELALDGGDDPAAVEAMLVEEGITAQAARDVVSARTMKVQGAARRRGLVRLLFGLGCGLLGIAILAVSAMALQIGVSSIFVTGLGITLTLLGGGLLVSGMRSMLPGRG